MHTVNSRRQHSTNSAGLRQSTAPYARPESSNADQANSNHAGSFPLRATRFPNGTPLIAKRSRKVYSDLADEREYLLKLREQWVGKLNSLKEDHKYLTKMKDISKEEIVGVEPLFSRGENEERPIDSQSTYNDARTPIDLEPTPNNIQTPTDPQNYQPHIDVNGTTDVLEVIANLRASLHGIADEEEVDLHALAGDGNDSDVGEEEMQRRALQNLMDIHGDLFK